MNKILLSAGIFTATLLPISAFAACSTPTADAGSMFYNTTVNTLQFCDGSDWYNTGIKSPSATGTSCSTPAGPEGSAFYNTSQNTVQFCNGDGWVNMGTMRFPSATGTSCTTPAGPEGSMFFNTTTGTMQFCNGDDWVNATYLTAAAYTEAVKLQSSSIDNDDRFGSSVDIEGEYAIVGSAADAVSGSVGAGAVYIFKRTGSVWSQQAKLTASDTLVNAYFGVSVSISGDTAAIGAYGVNSNSGAVYIFKRTGSSWAQQAKLQSSDIATGDLFASSVGISGDYVVAGADREATNGSMAGATYVFKRTGSTWAQEQKLVSSDISANDRFGFKVAIDGDYIISSSIGDDGAQGAGYVFKRTGVTWAQEQKLVSTTRVASDQLGIAVAIDGAYVALGAFHDVGGSNAGATFVFKRSGTSWAQEAKLLASDGESNDLFGIAVSIDGAKMAIGARGEGTAGVDPGATYIFKKESATWVQESKLQSSDKEHDDWFGGSLAMDNGMIIISSRNEDTGASNAGAVYIFE